MQHEAKRQRISRFIAASAACLLLAGATLGIILFWFGRGDLSQLASSEGNTLTRIELNQLIGTENYLPSTNTHDRSALARLTSHLHLPLSNPLEMLTSVLPETNTDVLQQHGSQSSLMRSITSWAATDNKLVMGWLPSTSAATSIQLIQDAPGMNVVSPSWFQLTDASGNISVHVLPSVVTYAHAHHLKVWAMVDNQFSSSLTHEVLGNPRAEVNLIDELVYQATVYGLDGINVDFENIASADRTVFTTFIHDLHQRLHAANINLSIDVSPDIVPLRDNAAFFHAALAENVDEIVLMAYDEHWSSDQDPGPVADVPWVKQSINDLLDTGVPTDKLILGMPFYTRYWHVHTNGSVTSSALSAGSVPNSLSQVHAPTGTWNSSLDLMYTRFPEPDGYMEIWYPTAQTYSDTLTFVNNDGLAGVSVWSLDWIDTQTWNSTMKFLKSSPS